MVNDKMENNLIMGKKKYICPETFVERVDTVLMQTFGPASMPTDPKTSIGSHPGRFIGW